MYKRQVWGKRFQVLVATHMNTDNLHNHFVINSVSYVDGKKYEQRRSCLLYTSFRDPKIWREADGTYSAVTVALTEDGSGAAVLFQSKDGFDRCV